MKTKTLQWHNNNLFTPLLKQYPNAPQIKQVICHLFQVIKAISKTIEDRSYWYYTSDEAQFLTKFYKTKVEQQTLQQKISKITDAKLDQLIEEIENGKLIKLNEQSQNKVETSLITKADKIVNKNEKYFSSQHPKTKQVQQKIGKINQSTKKFKEKIQLMRQKNLQKDQLKRNQQEQVKKALQQNRKELYHKQVENRMQVMKEKEVERVELNKKYKQFVKQYKNIKPLHVLMEEEYHEKVQLPILEKQQYVLGLRTSKRKPTLHQINEHERIYMQGKKNKEIPTIVNQTIHVSYKSHHHLQSQNQQEEINPHQTLVDQMNRKKMYSQLVKEQHQPSISKVLNQQIESKLHAKTNRKSLDRFETIENGKDNLKYMKNLSKKRDTQSPEQPSTMNISRYTNYLTELKQQHWKLHQGIGSNWQHDMTDPKASPVQRRERVIMKSRQLQEKAMLEEKFIQNNRYANAEQLMNKKKSIDDTLISSIKAKVAVLQDVHNI